jgi:hypothetical protein
MKRQFYLFYIVSIWVLSGCAKFLQEDPKSLIASTNFYKTNADAISAINGAYTAMRPDVTAAFHVTWINEVTSDDGTLGGTALGERLELSNQVYTAQHLFIQGVWNVAYNVINRANSVLANVDSAFVSPSLCRRLYGEARFLRAFYYFRLVRLYGDVPLLLEPSSSSNLYPPRTDVKEIYEQIIKDLQYAEVNLDEKYAHNDPLNGGRATMGAAKALLGHVYVTMAGYPVYDTGKWQAAADKLNEVISERSRYGYEFMPVYKDIFDRAKRNSNTELIFYYPGTSGVAAALLAYTRMQYWYWSFRTVIPTKEVTNSLYEPEDQRRFVNMGKKVGSTLQPITNASGAVVIAKYAGPALTNNADSDHDFPAMRYSDVLLLYAESLVELGGSSNLSAAAAIINQIRSAHGGSALPALSYTDQQDLREKLRVERRRELLFENHRRYDLIRWGIFVHTLKASMANEHNRPVEEYNYINDNMLLLPLPYNDFIANPNLRPQNPGY